MALTIANTEVIDDNKNGRGFNSLAIGTETVAPNNEIICTGDITAFYSDKRLKNFEGVIDNPVEKINRINGYFYRPNDKARELGETNFERRIGVCAQEIRDVLPEAVTRAPISDNSDEDFLTVRYDKLVALLIEAIKEQDDRIKDLEDHICRYEV